MDKPRQLLPDTHTLPAHFPVPGAGFLPVNAFVIKAQEPVLIDTGMAIDSDGFIESLEAVIDPKDLRWIWLTHDDADHTGNLQAVMNAAPNARLVAYSLAVLRMSTAWPVPMDRVRWLNPGESINAGDRNLTAIRPPLFDNPTTIGLFDDKTNAFFSADCFGAIIPRPVEDIAELEEGEIARGMLGWASLDTPWVHMVKPVDFQQALDRIRRLDAQHLFSGHLPPAAGMIEHFLQLLETVPATVPSVAPNQEALEQVLQGRRNAGD
ncbi:MAG: MBL fold metallo-hydrolase [Desulfuromonas sp.]|nr:MAG: MBL fold metallo-hydrolase [Desulfuromonas sp.]